MKWQKGSQTYLIEGTGEIVIDHVMDIVNVYASCRYVSREKNRSFALFIHIVNKEETAREKFSGVIIETWRGQRTYLI